MKRCVIGVMLLFVTLSAHSVSADEASRVVMKYEIHAWCDYAHYQNICFPTKFRFDFVPRAEGYTEFFVVLLGEDGQPRNPLSDNCLPLIFPDDIEGYVWALNATNESDQHPTPRMTVDAYRKLPPGFWACEMVIRHKS